MKKYQPYCDFTAHGKNIKSLFKKFRLFDSNILDHIELTTIVVFEAFTIESYINTIGSDNIKIWDELERLPWKKKISIIHKDAGKEMNWGNDSLQFAQEVFDIRDRLAHGKPQKIHGEMYLTHEEAKTH